MNPATANTRCMASCSALQMSGKGAVLRSNRLSPQMSVGASSRRWSHRSHGHSRPTSSWCSAFSASSKQLRHVGPGFRPQPKPWKAACSRGVPMSPRPVGRWAMQRATTSPIICPTQECTAPSNFPPGFKRWGLFPHGARPTQGLGKGISPGGNTSLCVR